jgi:ELWxxDGT repeat protein
MVVSLVAESYLMELFIFLPGMLHMGWKIINFNGKLFFYAEDGVHGRELWKTDGTEDGTMMVKDINPGTNSSALMSVGLNIMDGMLFFICDDGTHGPELWRSDGTTAGTKIVADFVPGSFGSSAVYFTKLNGKLIMVADAPSTGNELWVTSISSILPIALSEFKGLLSGNDGLLSWTTSSEQNTSHFEIERSTDRKNFTKAGTVTAAGNSSVEKQYAYTDRNITSLGAAVVYYRLKMIDIDNKFSYSRIVAVNINAKDAVVMLYPNPVRENTTLMISVTKKEKMSYKIIDQNGRTVQQKNIIVNEGSNLVMLETAALAAGAYTIVVNGPDINSTVKFVKQ